MNHVTRILVVAGIALVGAIVPASAPTANARGNGPTCITAPCGPQPATYHKCRLRDQILPCVQDPVEYGKEGPCFVIDKQGVKKYVSHEVAHRLLYGTAPDAGTC